MRNVTWEKSGRASRFFVVALLLFAISPGIVLAGDVVVDGEAKDFYSDDVIDNLTVINGGRAMLYGTTVNGNLTIEGEGSYAGTDTAPGCSVVGNVTVKNGGLLSIWYSTIGGNLQGDGAGHINFLASEVVGSIKMKGGADFNANNGGKVGGDVVIQTGTGFRLNWFTVGGKLHVSDNEGGGYIRITNCDIGNDLKVCKNDMGQDITIENNTVAGNLEVKDNSPTPTVSGNEVEGKVKVD
jgi:hypothetical protein